MARLTTKIGFCPDCRQHTVFIDVFDWKGVKLFRATCEVCKWVCPAGAETSSMAAATAARSHMISPEVIEKSRVERTMSPEKNPDKAKALPRVWPSPPAIPEWERPECGGRAPVKHPAEICWQKDRARLGRYPTEAEVVATSKDLNDEMVAYNRLTESFTKRVSANYSLTKEMLATLELNLNNSMFRPEVMDTMKALIERWRREFNEAWPNG